MADGCVLLPLKFVFSVHRAYVGRSVISDLRILNKPLSLSCVHPPASDGPRMFDRVRPDSVLYCFTYFELAHFILRATLLEAVCGLLRRIFFEVGPRAFCCTSVVMCELLLTYLLTYVVTARPYSPWGVLASVITNALLFPVNYLLSPSLKPQLPQILLHIFQPSQTRSSPFLHLSGLLSYIFLTVLPWSILATCPTHSKLFFLISATMSRSLYISLSSSSYSPYPCSTTGPHVPLNL